MAQQQIITKPYVGELQDNDSLFINHDGALRQVKKKDADLASSEEVAAEVAAREAFEAREVAAREAFEESETAAREAFEADIEGQMSEKANVDGYYEEMTVGDAEQLVATQFVEDNEPYLFRPTGGSADVGNRAYLDKIIGGTVAGNQLVQDPLFADSSKVTSRFSTATLSDGIATAVPTSAGTERGCGFTFGAWIANHKYLSSSDVKTTSAGSIKVGIGGGWGVTRTITANTWTRISAIVNPAESGTNGFVTFYQVNSLTTSDSIQYKLPQIFDLTAMFGSTIADYIYNLEQSSAGAGVAWFKKLFPKGYYEYNAGELLSVEGLESHDTVGFNQWDEEVESGYIKPSTGEEIADASKIRMKNYMRILPNTTYYKKAPSGFWNVYFDADKNYVGYGDANVNTTFTTPDNAYYMRCGFETAYGTTYNNDICINISNPSRNGEYEEYVKHSYPLDNSLTLRGIPKLDSFNNLYYDGDTYESDGTVTRKYGVVDLGTLTWVIGWNAFATSDIKNSIKIVPDTEMPNMICTAYPTVKYIGASDKQTAINLVYVDETYAFNGVLRIYDPSYTTASEFKTAMSGVMLVYELATPTTEEAEPYQYTQIVDDLGTEEFVSNSIVPVGHTTECPANLRDKLQHLPDLAGMDGTYLIQQSGKQMSLVYMPAVFPEIPTEDGTYTLKTVVASGVATLQWVAD